MRPSAMVGQGQTTIGNELATLDILRNSFLWKYKWPLTRASKQPQERAPHLPPSVHFFLLAFSPCTSLGVVALITPTATVCLMSLTANLPRGGNSAKGSTHMGLLGSSLTMAASPDLMNLGASSVDLPVRLSTFSRISANLQAM